MATQKNEPEAPQPEVAAHEGPSPIELAVEENKSKLVFLVIGLAFAVCAVFAFFYFQKQKQDAAALAFTSAETVEDFNLVALEHPGTIAAGNAMLRAADLLATDTKYDDAIKKIDIFLTDFPSHPRYAQGLLAKASISYTKGDLDTAEANFKKIKAEFNDSDVAPLAHVRLGDIAWDRGNKDEATTIYQDLARNYPANPYIDRTDKRIKMIQEAVPSEPSERQKTLQEEEEAKRKALEASALEEARKKIEEAQSNSPTGTPSEPITIPALTDPVPMIPEINLNPTDPKVPGVGLDPPAPVEPDSSEETPTEETLTEEPSTTEETPEEPAPDTGN